MPRNPPPAPRQRGEERRNSLLHTAARFFLERGFEATSVAAIASAASASKETVYRYFPTKEDLFTASLLHRAGELTAGLTPPLRPAEPPREALTHFGEALLRSMQREEFFLFYRTLAMEHTRFPGLSASFYELGPVRLQAQLQTYLEAQVQAGRLRRHDTAVAARQLFGLLASETIMRGELGLSSRRTTRDIERHVREALDGFLHGYGSTT